jgi:hypothetical protein
VSFAEMPVKIINNRTGGKVHILRDSVRMLRDLFHIKKRVQKMKYKTDAQYASVKKGLREKSFFLYSSLINRHS